MTNIQQYTPYRYTTPEPTDAQPFTITTTTATNVNDVDMSGETTSYTINIENIPNYDPILANVYPSEGIFNENIQEVDIDYERIIRNRQRENTRFNHSINHGARISGNRTVYGVDRRIVDTKILKLSKEASFTTKESISKLLTKGRLCIEVYNKLCDIIDSLDEFKSNEWDIKLRFSAKTSIFTNNYGVNRLRIREVTGYQLVGVDIILYYPAITIVNSEKNLFNIKDLYVKIPAEIYEGGVLYFNPIQGARTTITYNEYVKGYVHSHLPSRAFSRQDRDKCDFGAFCIGDGEIHAVRSLINGGFEKDLFELYILNIETYLNWESIEGGPYNSMRILTDRLPNVKKVSIDWCREVYTRFMDQKQPLTFNWKIENGRYTIIDDEVFEKYFIEMRAYLPSRYRDRLYYFKNTKGEYFKDRLENSNEPEIRTYTDHLSFRREKRYFTVERGNNNGTIAKTFYLHPVVKDYIKKRFEYYANKAKLRDIGITRLREGNNSK